eukprot:5256030-Amphidinium_carterae.1
MFPDMGLISKEEAVSPAIRHANGPLRVLVFFTTKRNIFLANITVEAKGMEECSHTKVGGCGGSGSAGSTGSAALVAPRCSLDFSRLSLGAGFSSPGCSTLPSSSRKCSTPSSAVAGTVPSPRKSKRKRFVCGSVPETTVASKTAAKLA